MTILAFTDNEIIVIMVFAILIGLILTSTLIFKKYIKYLSAPRNIIHEKNFKTLLAIHFLSCILLSGVGVVIIRNLNIQSIVTIDLWFPISFILLCFTLSPIIGKLIDFSYLIVSKKFRNYYHK